MLILKALFLSGVFLLAGRPLAQQATIQVDAVPDEHGNVALSLVVGDEPAHVIAASVQVSPVWIGVRMVPVPDALAAHIHREGMMISNVVAGSPADEAGLEQYDVVVSFDGEEIETGEQLVERIAEVGVGRRAKVVVIRGGAEQSLWIRPADRPEHPSHEYKYDEPAMAGNDTNYFGHNMVVTPDGKWQMQPLGQMRDLSELLDEFDLEELKDFQFPDNSGMMPRFRMRSFPGMEFDFDFNWKDLGEVDGDVEIVIRSSDGDETLEIKRNADGTFRVVREDDAGERVDEYESAEQFEAQDPEAFEMFQGHSGHGSGAMIFMHPGGKDLPRMQRDFSAKIEKRIREAHERATAALQHGDQARQRVIRRQRSMSTSDQSGAHETQLQVSIGDDGVRVELVEDGVRKVYEFEDEAHFKRSEPELYERCGLGGR